MMRHYFLLVATLLFICCSADNETKAFLKGGQSNISVTFSLPDVSAINHIHADKSDNTYYTLNGQRVEHPTKGIYIVNGKKIIL